MNSISLWLKGQLEREHLSLRQAAEMTGLSHATIADVSRGVAPRPETIRKLAQAFAAGENERLALEDELLILADYRSPRPEGEEPSVAYATLIDKVSEFRDAQLRIMINFADFLVEMGKRE